MRTYNKRIGFLISDQHLIAHGGIGQFAKSFTEMADRLNWKVDIIIDKKPTNVFSEVVQSMGANIVYPKEAVSYSEHTNLYAFSDSVNFEKVINFRRSILTAFNTNIYDMLICNTVESMMAALCYDFGKYIPVVFYTHEESMVFRKSRNFKGVYNNSTTDFINRLMTVDNVVIGTQSPRNVDELLKNGAISVKHLGMPLSERELLEPSTVNKSGVLFIGRWENRKNPEAFLNVIKETNLPAKVMTNTNGAKKFQAAFDEMNITNYEMKVGIVGKEKVDFIKSSKVHYNPSYRENYPFTFYESLGHCQCVVLDVQDWSTNFDDQYYHTTTTKQASSLIKQLHDDPYDNSSALNYVKSLDDMIPEQWQTFLNEFNKKKSSNDSAKICKEVTTSYKDFIISLNRKNLAQEDIVSVLSNVTKFKVIYTDSNSYLTKDENYIPNENVGANLFEGL